jgi:hypothetical protein
MVAMNMSRWRIGPGWSRPGAAVTGSARLLSVAHRGPASRYSFLLFGTRCLSWRWHMERKLVHVLTAYTSGNSSRSPAVAPIRSRAERRWWRLWRRFLVGWRFFGVTAQPTAERIANQLTEACGWEQIPRYLSGIAMVHTERYFSARPTSPRSAWQNAYAERLIGSILTISWCSANAICAMCCPPD